MIRRATIEAVDPSAEEVRPGQEVSLRVRLRKREGGDVAVETLTVRIPESAEAGTFAFDVMGGDLVPADVANPVDVADLPALTAAFYKSGEIVAVVPTGRVDLDMDGRLVRDVPLSSIPRLVRSHEGPSVQLRPVTQKVRRDVPYVVEGSERVTLTDLEIAAPEVDLDLVALDEALEELSKDEPRLAEVVTMRVFAGMSIEETAQAMEISPATVKRDWLFARAWLTERIGGRPEDGA